MLTALAGLVLLFLVCALLWWWARGGVIPALMLSAPVAAFVPVLGILISNAPNEANMLWAPVAMLAWLTLAWAPLLLRVRI